MIFRATAWLQPSLIAKVYGCIKYKIEKLRVFPAWRGSTPRRSQSGTNVKTIVAIAECRSWPDKNSSDKVTSPESEAQTTYSAWLLSMDRKVNPESGSIVCRIGRMRFWRHGRSEV